MPTIVHPVLHETTLARVGSLPHYRATYDHWSTETKSVRVSEENESGRLIRLVPLLVESLASVQFQEFDLDQVLLTRREHAFLLLQ